MIILALVTIKYIKRVYMEFDIELPTKVVSISTSLYLLANNLIIQFFYCRRNSFILCMSNNMKRNQVDLEINNLIHIIINFICRKIKTQYRR